MTNQLAAGCYHLTRSQLLYDLYVAFYDAARHKHKMAYVKKFEANLAENLNELCDDLLTRRYKALPSKCFIVSYPKKREVFCAAFRDRIIHHLYFRYTHQLFERTFIADSDVAREARERGVTRSAVSMERAARLEGPLVFAIGNAPTALVRLCELLRQGTLCQPALVIGVPVGFVNVVESKELVLEAGVEHIVARGRKGGSNVAASIVNALLYLASGDRRS